MGYTPVLWCFSSCFRCFWAPYRSPCSPGRESFLPTRPAGTITRESPLWLQEAVLPVFWRFMGQHLPISVSIGWLELSCFYAGCSAFFCLSGTAVRINPPLLSNDPSAAETYIFNILSIQRHNILISAVSRMGETPACIRCLHSDFIPISRCSLTETGAPYGAPVSSDYGMIPEKPDGSSFSVKPFATY